jgi:uncharacterized membrane protein
MPVLNSSRIPQRAHDPQALGQFTGVLDRNIATLVVALRRESERKKSIQDRVADVITTFTGSMPFVYLHMLWTGG